MLTLLLHADPQIGMACFKKCARTGGGEKLSSKEQQCLAMCQDRYVDTMNLVSNAYMERAQRQCTSDCRRRRCARRICIARSKSAPILALTLTPASLAPCTPTGKRPPANDNRTTSFSCTDVLRAWGYWPPSAWGKGAGKGRAPVRWGEPARGGAPLRCVWHRVPGYIPSAGLGTLAALLRCPATATSPPLISTRDCRPQNPPPTPRTPQPRKPPPRTTTAPFRVPSHSIPPRQG